MVLMIRGAVCSLVLYFVAAGSGGAIYAAVKPDRN